MQFNILKNLIFNILHNLQGEDIIFLNVQKKSSIIDAMIICTGISNRHVISLAQNILVKFHDMKLKIYGIEGIKIGDWILIDLGNIVIHIMSTQSRKLYQLEKIWE